jgi:hypothetical protein
MTSTSTSRSCTRLARHPRSTSDPRVKGSGSGSVFGTTDGYGIRWPEDGKRPQKTGFRTKTEARRWFADNVAPGSATLARRARSATTRSARCSSSGTAPPSPGRPSRRWRSGSPTAAPGSVAGRCASSRTRPRTSPPGGPSTPTVPALPGHLGDAAGTRGRRPLEVPDAQPGRRRGQEPAAAGRGDPSLRPRRGRHDHPRARPARVLVAAETGLRPEEWIALERRDLDRQGRALAVQRKYAKGVLRPYGKNHRSRRRVPLTGRAFGAFEQLPPRLDTTLLFPAPQGGHLALDNWRNRVWYPERRPESRSAAPTTCGTRSRPRRSPPVCRRSSFPG